MYADPGLRLAVQYGAAGVVAVLAWPDGRWLTLMFDGAPVLSAGVYAESDGRLLTGREAWERAAADPSRWIASPLRVGEATVDVDGVGVAVQDVVAAGLRRVCDEAARLAGAAVVDVRLVVPAGWGPRRRTWMRQAAFRAGLGQPVLVEAPVAAANQVLAGGAQFPVGAFLLMCDAGAGFEVSVLRRGPTGFEVLSTLADPAAGGDGVDERLAASFTAMQPDDAVLSPADVWVLKTSARTAKQSLSQMAAVAVPQPAGRPPVVVNVAMLQDAAVAVVARAAQLCVEAVEAAELTPDRLAGVFCIGGGARLSALPRAIGERLALTPVVAGEPGLAAVFGAVGVGAATPDTHTEVQVAPPVPPLRRIAAMAVPAALSLVLVVHFLYTVDYGGGGTRTYRPLRSWVIANWGELAVACVLVVIGCLAMGTVLGTVVSGLDRFSDQGRPVSPGSQVATGVLAATAVGLAVAGLYAVLGSAYLSTEATPMLRWALLPVAPVAVIALIIAVLAARWRRAPAQGWDGFLAFPMTSVLATAAGTVLIQQAMRSPAIGVTGRVGGLLIGVGVAAALVSRWLLRLIVALPLSVLFAGIVSWPATGALAVIFAVAVTLWWAQRLWELIRSPIRSDGARSPDVRTVVSSGS